MAEKPVTKEYLDKSLDKLGRMIKRSFDEVYKKFDDVDQKFDGVFKKFDNVDQKFEEVFKKFDDVYKKFDDVDQKFDEVYKKLDILNENDKIIMARLEGIVYRKEFEELKARVETIEEALAIKTTTHPPPSHLPKANGPQKT